MAPYGEALWDKYNIVSARADETMDICRDTVSFFQKLAGIEKEYAKSILALTKNESVSAKGMFKSSNITSRERGSLQQSWVALQFELEKVAKIHNELAEQSKTQITDPMVEYIKETEKWKKGIQKTGAKSLEEMKTAAEKMAKKAEALTSLRKDVEKQQQQASKNLDKTEKKLQEAEEEYKMSEIAANDTAVLVYTTTLPVVLNDMQDMEEKRIDFMTNSMKALHSILCATVPAMDEVCKALELAVGLINKEQDIASFIAENRSGKNPPQSATDGIEALKGNSKKADTMAKKIEQVSSTSSPSLQRQQTSAVMRASGVGSPVISSAGGSAGSSSSSSNNNNNNANPNSAAALATAPLQTYDDLPAEERKQKLKEQMDRVRKTMQVEKNALDGMKNLMQMYSAQPEMQQKVAGQMSASESNYQELENKNKAYAEILATLGENEVAEGNFDILIPLKPHKKAKALYDFTATADGELSFTEGQEITLTAKGNCGWAEGRTPDGRVGLIPLNYIEEQP